jgi:hypothetical protein
METKRIDYTLARVGNMLRWLVTSGVITFFLIELNNWVGTLELSPQVATGIFMIVNTLLFAVRSYSEGNQK